MQFMEASTPPTTYQWWRTSCNICRKCNLWRHQLHLQHTSDDALRVTYVENAIYGGINSTYNIPVMTHFMNTIYGISRACTLRGDS